MARAHKTFHINVPEEDLELMEWLSVQYNQSSSVRELIRAAYREYGPVDLFTGQTAERTPGVRGRAKQAKGVESTEQSRKIAAAAARAASLRESLTDKGNGSEQEGEKAGGKDSAGESADKSENARGSAGKKKAGTRPDTATTATTAAISASSQRKTEKPTTSVPAEKAKGKARAPSKEEPSQKRGGIRMGLDVLAAASGKSAPSKKPETGKGKKERRDGNKKEDAIRNLMDMMDM